MTNATLLSRQEETDLTHKKRNWPKIGPFVCSYRYMCRAAGRRGADEALWKFAPDYSHLLFKTRSKVIN